MSEHIQHSQYRLAFTELIFSGIVSILRFIFNWCISLYMLYKILDLLFMYVISSPKDDVKIYAKPTPQNVSIQKSCPSLKRYYSFSIKLNFSGYHYPLWAINGHLQTLYATLGREYNAPASNDVYKRYISHHIHIQPH